MESYDEMNDKKPVKNPQEEEGRQLDREFLNRSVQIIIEEVSYPPKKGDNSGQSK